MSDEPSRLPAELRTLVKRYGTRVLEDPDGLRATLDDFLDEGAAAPGDVNLLVDAVRFGSLERLKTLMGQGADPTAATADVGEALAQRRGGDADSAYWACAVLGYAADLLPAELVPGTWERPSSQLPRAVSATDPTSSSASVPVGDTTYLVDQTVARVGMASGGDDSPAAPSPDQSATGPAPDGRHTSGRRPRTTLIVTGVVLAVAVLAVGAYLLLTRVGNDSPAAGADVPVSDILPHFEHFGTSEDMLRSLDTCTNAAVAGSTYQDYNCRFKPQYGPFIVNFTEQNALVRNSGGQLPHIVEFPPANTLVTQQQAGAQSYHAYYMQWQGPGADGQRNTGNDDQVNLTLYDVDPTHPGAAIFSTEDAQSDPLTEKKANQLLAAIGFDKDKFPLPTPFGGYGNFEQFGRMFLSPNQFRQCIPAFTVFNGEYSHVTCPLGSTSVDFGYVHNLQKVKNRYRGGQQYTWTDGAGNSGSANVRTYSGQTHLYWYQDPESTGTFGVLTTRAHPGASTELLKFFESLQSHPTVQ